MGYFKDAGHYCKEDTDQIRQGEQDTFSLICSKSEFSVIPGKALITRIQRARHRLIQEITKSVFRK